MIAILISLYMVFFLLAVFADHLPFLLLVKTIVQITANSAQTIKSTAIIDADKEKILLNNSFQLFIKSLAIMGLIVLLVLCGTALLFITNLLFKPLPFQLLVNDALSIAGVIISVISFSSYYFAKKIYVRVRL